MSRRARVVGLVSGMLAVAALVATPAQAETGRKLDPRPSTVKLAAELHKLELLSFGRVDVDLAGRSNEGRPVWTARVGNGPLRILYVTQQHGDEPLGTPAALEFLRTAGVGNSAWQRSLRSKVTVEIVVRANPDGHERDWRFNYDPGADPEFGERGKGYDINRYHNPAVAPKDNPATEAAIIQRRFAAFRPAITVDYHMQGRYVGDDGREITASVMWPTHPGVAAKDVAFAKQISVVAQRSIDAAGGNTSQYPGGNYEGIARNGYGLLGSGSVLIELSAMEKQHEQAQIRSALASMLAIARSAADGSVRDIDPAQAEAIPPRGKPLPGTDEEHSEAA
ncbi:M14 family zinc carboxypeptidase [Amycolatopsis suaedae]|uniref:Peptidase M14 n=1 Tax=Amycolatopsis suaedae TaxID=2510978 RepID=A0A4Q7J3B1_9PSEU|nr:M14 family zinc carboxypeptidase [Amycolatopsis suaedae]RZQ61981.1 peptidase M14 [Amycolatopsis suaedae]